MEYETTYTPPDCLQSMDEEEILGDMLSQLPADIDKTEGGFAWDMIKPTALQVAMQTVAMNDMLQIWFPEWSYGNFLDMIAATVGLTRKDATYAEAVLQVTGTAGTVIPSGFLFATSGTEYSDEYEFATQEEITLNEDGEAEFTVVCTVGGSEGNVPNNAITLMITPLTGIETITNPDPAYGGVDEETDDELRERVKERDMEGPQSFVGSNADYKRWAKTIAGVGSAIVIPEWQGHGTGTVKIIVMDDDGQPVSQTVINDVYNYIMSPGNEDSRLAPIGAVLTVATSSLSQFSYSATIMLESGTELTTVMESFKLALTEYYEEAKEDGMASDTGIGYIRYTRIGSILSSIDGVADYSNLLVNNGQVNVAIGADEYPYTYAVAFTAAS